MIFTDIRLQNYRSYDEASFEVGPGVNIVVGPNAAGKTNLLEAVMVAAIGKSFRAKDQLLVKNHSEWSRLDTHTSDNQTRITKIQLRNGQTPLKTFSIDEKDYRRLPLREKQPIVLFQPDDLRLMYGEPSRRRDYLDDLLEQIDPNYTRLRSNLKRVLSQRNSLLKQLDTVDSQIFAWDLRLVETATKVVEARLQLVEALNARLSEVYGSICGVSTPISLEYFSKTNVSNYSDSLMRELVARLETDKLRGFTTRGPHLDDVLVDFRDSNLVDSASRGENRTFVLALKIIELQILEEKTSVRPILLLDDVFSELDGSRRRALTAFLENHQTVITTTDADIALKIIDSRQNIIAL
jgi:DNA replication and repair protein RecF